MKVNKTLDKGLQRKYEITVPAAEIDMRMEQELTRMGQTAKLKGFRPGKVPMQVLKKQFGKEVMGKVLDAVVQDSTQKTIANENIRPAAQPKINIKDFKEGEDLSYELDMELMPEITPMDFAKIKLEKLLPEIDEKEVDETLKQFASQSKQFDKANRAAKKGDQVQIGFVGKIDGEAFDGGSMENHHLELGSNAFIPGFEDQLIGTKEGDKKDVKVTFPAEYHAEDLKGKEAVFEVEIKQVNEPVESQVDEKLAKSMGFEKLEDMRKAVRERLEAEYAGLARTHTKRLLLDQLDEAHAFELPEGVVKAEFEDIWRQYEQHKKSGSLDEADKKKSDDDMKKELHTIAERRVRLGLLLSEVGQTQKITINDDELRQALLNEAGKYPGQEKQVLEYYKNNPQALVALRAPILEDKVVDYILSLAKVTEKKVNKDDLIKSIESLDQ